MIPIPEQLRDSETPFPLIDEQRMRESLSAVRSHLPPETRLFYSVKTNYELPVLKSLEREGIGAEISSGFELALARKAGFPPDRIILDGPGWREAELEAAITAGIRLFNLDSLSMASLLSSVSARLGKASPVGVRVRTASYPRFGLLPALGKKFGISVRESVEFARAISRMKGLEFQGLSTHTGTALARPGPLVRSIRSLFRVSDTLRKRGFPVSSLNFGGGLPAPGTRTHTSLDLLRIQLGMSPRPVRPDAPDLSRFCREVAGAVRRELDTRRPYGGETAFEPGRSLVSGAGILVTRVRAVKEKWIVIDGGVNLLPESPFFLGRNFRLPGKEGEKPAGRYHISGPSLNTVDVLGLGIPLPRPETGDILVVENAGAYSISRSNQFTRLRPPVYFLGADGALVTGRAAESIDDFMNTWPE